jgi:hypothetical protein
MNTEGGDKANSDGIDNGSNAAINASNRTNLYVKRYIMICVYLFCPYFIYAQWAKNEIPIYPILNDGKLLFECERLLGHALSTSGDS